MELKRITYNYVDSLRVQTESEVAENDKYILNQKSQGLFVATTDFARELPFCHVHVPALTVTLTSHNLSHRCIICIILLFHSALFHCACACACVYKKFAVSYVFVSVCVSYAILPTPAVSIVQRSPAINIMCSKTRRSGA